MSFEYKLLLRRGSYSTTTPIIEVVGECNNPKLPGGILEKLVQEFEKVNYADLQPGDDIFVPILPPFVKKHAGENIFTLEELKLDRSEPEPEPKEETPQPPKEVSSDESLSREETKPEIPSEGKVGTLHYRTYPYTFSRPGETIEAVVRLYNDMNVSRTVIDQLVYEFSSINKEALPPRLGQEVRVPVLLPFCYRHENENKIFTDE